MKRLKITASVFLLVMIVFSCMFASSASAETTLETPQLLNVSCASATSNTVYWDAVEGATGYRIYRKTATAKAWTGLANVKSDKLSYKDAKAKSGTQYYYTVRAFDQSSGKTVWSGYQSGIYSLKTPTVSVMTDTEDIAIKWTKVPGATGYKIYRRKIGASWSGLTVIDGNFTSYTDESAGSTAYYYTVRAIREAGATTAYSWYTGGVYAMKTPTVLNVNTLAATSHRVYWNKVNGADGYRIYRKTNSAKGWTGLANVSANTTNYTDKKATANTQYSYTVKAYKKVSGKTFWSGYTSGMKSLGIPKLNIAGIDPSNNTFKVYISSVANATEYKAYYKEPGKSWKAYGTMQRQSDGSIDMGKVAYKQGTRFTVRAVRNLNGVYAYSWYSTNGIATCINAPKITNVTATAANKIKVSWNKVSNASGYVIFSKASTDSSWAKIAEVSNNYTTYNHTTPESFEVRSYLVRALYNSGNITLSSLNSGSMSSLATPLHAYLPYSEEDGSSYCNFLIWEEIPGAQSYRIYRCVDGGSWKAIANVSASDELYYEDYTASEFEYYHYTVRAVRKTNNTESMSWFYNRHFDHDALVNSMTETANNYSNIDLVFTTRTDLNYDLICYTATDFWDTAENLDEFMTAIIDEYANSLGSNEHGTLYVTVYKSKSLNECTYVIQSNTVNS